ncbi:DUF2922 domain-containing protein [Clostridium sp. CCUG 7971]|uniref:DUF2922 domain-containing protein n=1 Tax=Clostridium sp. CCUG 7971 TaxID=2811414 RepID=UPI001ABA4DF1|nr:DUF2922 domain-containing protein [Clostridium sp. CCUG 7971]MBO3443480.1 DUF2922 domain-containing protein [Clostridium sp. CCUG 7971]
METKTRLIMTFKTDGEKNVSVSVDDPRTDITEEDIKDAMDLLLLKDVFAPNGEGFISKVDAKIVTTDTQEFDLAL